MRSLDSNLSRSLSAPPFGSVSFQRLTLEAAEKLPGIAGSAPESRRDGLVRLKVYLVGEVQVLFRHTLSGL
jgi:hypothetical protein